MGWRNNELLHDELVDALEELPEDLAEQLRRPLQSQLLDLHRMQEDSDWAVGSTAATHALKDLLREVIKAEFEMLAGGPALGDGDVVPHAGELQGMVVQLDWRFVVAHYGQKPPTETPTRIMPGVAEAAVGVVPCVDDGVAQLGLQPEDQSPLATPDGPVCDAAVSIEVAGCWVAKVAYAEDAPRRTGPPDSSNHQTQATARLKRPPDSSKLRCSTR